MQIMPQETTEKSRDCHVEQANPNVTLVIALKVKKKVFKYPPQHSKFTSLQLSDDNGLT